MARYAGPVCRLCRREGVKLFLKADRCFTPKCAIDKRNTPPGARRNRPPRQRSTNYAMQLREKQKIRRTYGLMEKQFRRHYREAERQIGETGVNLLLLLECRLDNVVFRMGFASSRRQARQLVNHGHFLVNGKKLDVPSASLNIGDEISIRVKSRKLDVIQVSQERASDIGRPSWVEVQPEKLVGKIVAVPERENIDVVVNEQLIVEYYSR